MVEAKASTPRIRLRWLEQHTPTFFSGTTWGVAWPQGQIKANQNFELHSASGHPVPIQSWPQAYWPDGSIKWSAHALAAPAEATDEHYEIAPTTAISHSAKISAIPPLATTTDNGVSVQTGGLSCRINTGEVFLTQVVSRGAERITQGRLLLKIEHSIGQSDSDETIQTHLYKGHVSEVLLEQSGPIRAVVKVSGAHHGQNGADYLPFVLRFYFYKNQPTFRVVHTLVHNVPPEQGTIRGIGLELSIPLNGHFYDRHIRFVTAQGGVFSESIQGLTGLRRDPGETIRQAQLAGSSAPPQSTWSKAVQDTLAFIPVYSQYSLLQAQSEGYSISKRIDANNSWVHAQSGHRASGSGFIGDGSGGVAFGIRNFWQSFPAQIDITHTQTDLAHTTLWLWAPDGPPMDVRPYHTPTNEQTFQDQRKALDITYEDYEPGFSSAYGVGRTSELEFAFYEATPSNTQLVAFDQCLQTPPRLLPELDTIFRAQALHAFWSPAPEHTQNTTETTLGTLFDFYKKQVEQRKWYGFWDYGDIMHTYDADMHTWRYDVGGYAWDNGELSSLIWLWNAFLHSGRPDIFHMAEAMTRHMTEVDVYHLGPFAPLGSRHNVQHWGDSAKQLRIASVANVKTYLFLTADERTGDLMRAQVKAANRLRQIVPGRKIGDHAPQQNPEQHITVTFGTDWGAIAAAWLLEWERTGNTMMRDRLMLSMESIAAQPHGFFTGSGIMDLQNGLFKPDTTGRISVSHLSAVFGLPETCSELIALLPSPSFKKAWLDYCILYNAPPQAQKAALGRELGHLNLGQAHARLLAYAGALLNNHEMRRKAWLIFQKGAAGMIPKEAQILTIYPPNVAETVDEAPGLSTNAVAQWGLGAIGLLALAPNEQVDSL
ncbi:hypothetical protein [Acetobacter orientalis]|uniref:exo-rhamnogalacturonan lyase family protein n=1 Tax=Acetobacter orientalis TaxID=146474 RepID=UPI0039E91094